MTQLIPLSKLRLSDSNVRKSGATSIEQLAADIEARGVLQNLLVTPLKKPRGHYAVFAGGHCAAHLVDRPTMTKGSRPRPGAHLFLFRLRRESAVQN